MSQPDRRINSERIARKEEALAGYERILDEVFLQIGHSYSTASDRWPSIYDRFKAIDKELHYRTTYAALCSQAHNDPEDLLNDFIHGVTQVPGAKEAQKIENENFAVFMLLASLSLLIESSAMYLEKYSLHASNALNALSRLATEAALEAVGEPKGPR